LTVEGDRLKSRTGLTEKLLAVVQPEVCARVGCERMIFRIFEGRGEVRM
jgi:hypothetical protein